MRISLSELRVISDRIFTFLEREAGTDIELNRDYYWSISPNERFSIYSEPKELGMGQLSHDWERLLALLQDDELVTILACEWLGEILSAIAQDKCIDD